MGQFLCSQLLEGSEIPDGCAVCVPELDLSVHGVISRLLWLCVLMASSAVVLSRSDHGFETVSSPFSIKKVFYTCLCVCVCLSVRLCVHPPYMVGLWRYFPRAHMWLMCA